MGVAAPRRARPWLVCGLLAALAGVLAAGLLVARDDAAAFRAEADRVRLDPLGLGAFRADPVPRRPGVSRVVIVGDSRAAEWPAPRVAGVPGLETINRGVGGQTAAQVAGRYGAHVTPLAPDVVLVVAGTNDLVAARVVGTPAGRAAVTAQALADVRAVVDRATADGAAVVVATAWPPKRPPIVGQRDHAPPLAELARFNAGVRALDTASGPRVRVLDAAAVLAGGDGYVRPEYARDALHLTRAGYAALDAALAPLLADALARP